MKTPIAAAALALLVAPGIPAWSQTAPPAAASDARTPTAPAIQQIVDRVKPALVRIHVVEAHPEDGHETKEEAFGSGIIVSADGYVVTNHHVAGKARWLSCTLSSKEEVGAHLIATDPLADIAVIKLDPLPNGAPYPTATWGDSAKLRVGDAVLAMGSPLAFSQSVTSGIVSNTELIMPQMMGEGLQMEGEDVGSIVRWIGHDAQIFPGNSGGPLISMSGEIVGINEIGVGLSGAIPSNIAHAVAEQLIANHHVTRAYLGVDLQPRLHGLTAADARPELSGVLVGGVLPNSPALRAGIKSGDILLKIGDTAVNASYPEEIPLVNLQIANLAVGVPVAVTVLREGKATPLTVTPALREPAENPSIELKNWGATAADITPPQALDLRRSPTSHGVVITSIATGGPSAEAQPPLKEGDILLTVAGKPVDTLAAVRTVTEGLVAGAAAESGAAALVEVQRDGERILTVVTLGKHGAEDTSDEIAKAWLPVAVQALTPPLVTALHLPEGLHGVRVTQVYPLGTVSAGAPHLQVGDLLTKLDGETIDVSQPEEAATFFTLLRQYHIGAPVKVNGFRNGKPLSVTLTTVRAPKAEGEQPHYADAEFGFTVRSVNYKDRADEDAGPTENGALVMDVAKGSWAALGGLRDGDIIRQIDSTPVEGLESAEAALKALAARKPQRVRFFVSRGIHTLYVETQTDYSLSAAPTGGRVENGAATPSHPTATKAHP